MITFIFNRLNKLDREGKGRISFQITARGERKYLKSDFCILPEEWDKGKSEVNKKNPHYIAINKALREKKRKWEDRETELKTLGYSYTVHDIIAEPKCNFKNFVEYCCHEAQKRLELGDIQYSQYNSYCNVIDEIVRYKGKTIAFKDVDLKFVNDFKEHVIRHRQDLSDVSKRKYLNTLKALVNACADDKLIEPIPTNRIQNIKAVSRLRENLTFQQLKELETVEFQDKDLDFYRDLFLAGCYTGLRFSDLSTLKKENLIPDNNGGLWLKVLEKKTKKWKFNIPLHLLFNGKVLPIFDKYRSKYRDTIFPSITAQAVNRCLKVIHQIMKFDFENLTFHISRHTFGTLLAELNVPIYIIKEYMNHGDLKTTERYIHNSRMNQTEMLKEVVFPE